MSDTPRTDSAATDAGEIQIVPAHFARKLERELAAAKAQGETISCSHVRQGDYVVKRLFMCHACIEQVKACYIQNTAPQDRSPKRDEWAASTVHPPADAAPGRVRVSDIAFERYEAEYERVLYMEKSTEMFGPEHQRIARRAMIELAINECSKP